MTILKNTQNGKAQRLWAWALALICAVCLSFVGSFVRPALAAEAKTFEQTMKITQTVDNTSGTPQRTKYTYTLRPNIEGTPMPTKGDGTYDEKTNTYTFTLDGNDSIDIPITFRVDDETNYQYLLEREEDVPVGDIVTPKDHHFGYLFRTEDGSLTIIPYTCYDNQFKIWDKTDSEGNPVGVTLENILKGTKSQGEKGDKGDKGDQGDKGDPGADGTNGKDGSDGKNGKDGSDGKNGVDGKNGTNGTNGRDGTNGKDGVTTIKTITQNIAKAVNTGDPNHVLLWGGLVVLSAGALLAILVLRRKHEREDEND